MRTLTVVGCFCVNFLCVCIEFTIAATTLCHRTVSPTDPSVYWINLNSSVDRYEYTSQMLSKLSFNNTRISAVHADSLEYIEGLEKLEMPCKRNTPLEISCIMSHLKAIHTAVHDINSKSDYALILEDDVKILYDIDFSKLVVSAPSADFGVLQLTTSNMEALHLMWNDVQYACMKGGSWAWTDSNNKKCVAALWRHNRWTDKTKDGRYALFWSAQAYLINKRVVQPLIDDIVSVHRTNGGLSYKIINSFSPKTCERLKARPCVLANCLFADTYIFQAVGPTFVSAIPLVTGSKMGYISQLHQGHVSGHQEAFNFIKNITHSLMRGGSDNSGHASNSVNINARGGGGGNSSNYVQQLPPYLRSFCESRQNHQYDQRSTHISQLIANDG